MPDIDGGEYLIGYLRELGFCQSNGMGVSELSFQEISAWMHATGLRLNPWEALTLKKLSSEYVAQLHASKDPLEPAPFGDGELEIKRDYTANFFMKLAKQSAIDDTPEVVEGER